MKRASALRAATSRMPCALIHIAGNIASGSARNVSSVSSVQTRPSSRACSQRRGIVERRIACDLAPDQTCEVRPAMIFADGSSEMARATGRKTAPHRPRRRCLRSMTARNPSAADAIMPAAGASRSSPAGRCPIPRPRPRRLPSSIWRTLAFGLLAGNVSNFSVAGSKRTTRVGAEVGEPDLVLRRRPRPNTCAGARPAAPIRATRRRPDRSMPTWPAVPLAHPDAAFRIRPDSARALVLRRRLDHRRLAGLQIDPRDVAAGERGVVDVAAGVVVIPYGPRPRGAFHTFMSPVSGIEAAVVAALPVNQTCRPCVERQRVEVGVAAPSAAERPRPRASPGRRARSRSGRRR